MKKLLALILTLALAACLFADCGNNAQPNMGYLLPHAL